MIVHVSPICGARAGLHTDDEHAGRLDRRNRRSARSAHRHAVARAARPDVDDEARVTGVARKLKAAEDVVRGAIGFASVPGLTVPSMSYWRSVRS